jgi:cytohesin
MKPFASCAILSNRSSIGIFGGGYVKGPLPFLLVGEWTPPNSQYPPPKQGEPSLHQAARLGNHDAIRTLVADGSDIDEQFDVGLDPGARPHWATPLMVAAGSADGATVETVRFLLELGASVAPSASNMNALTFACLGLGWNYPPGGDAARVLALLEAGADPNEAGAALAFAARSGDPERLGLMLAAGADLDHPAMKYLRPIHAAAAGRSGECVQLLLDAGADPEERSAVMGHTALADAGSVAVVRVLLAAGADPHASLRHGASIAREIAERREMSIAERGDALRLLQDAGVDVDAKSESGTTAIARSAMVGDADAVAVFLNAGANPHIDHGPMQLACFASVSAEEYADYGRVIELLVAAGVNPNDVDEAGFRPIHAAVFDDNYGPGYQESDGVNVPAIVALGKVGADLDAAVPDTGERPIHIAAQQGHAGAVRALLEAGIDPGSPAPDGTTTLDLARRSVASWQARLDANEDDRLTSYYENRVADARAAVDLLARR